MSFAPARGRGDRDGRGIARIADRQRESVGAIGDDRPSSAAADSNCYFLASATEPVVDLPVNLNTAQVIDRSNLAHDPRVGHQVAMS